MVLSPLSSHFVMDDAYRRALLDEARTLDEKCSGAFDGRLPWAQHVDTAVSIANTLTMVYNESEYGWDEIEIESGIKRSQILRYRKVFKYPFLQVRV